jgi:hypothetical protein
MGLELSVRSVFVVVAVVTAIIAGRAANAVNDQTNG